MNSQIFDECMKLLDENIEVLSDIGYLLEADKEDQVVSGLTRSDLVEMAHDVADCARIKKTESDFAKRYFERNLVD